MVAIEGKTTGWMTLSLTNDAATTDRVNMDGYASGRIINASGAQIVIDYYDAETDTSTAYIAEDEDGEEMTQTIPDLRSRAIKSGAFACQFLTLVLDGTAAAQVKIKLVR